MKAAAAVLGAATALWLSAAAMPARAEAPAVRTDFAAPGSNWTVNPAARRSVQWNAASRWGLKLDMDQPVNRDMDWKDVQAGAYFRLTPQLRVGGSVGLGSPLVAAPQKLLPQDAAPRVHVETAFQF